jgi:hypothetical protein
MAEQALLPDPTSLHLLGVVPASVSWEQPSRPQISGVKVPSHQLTGSDE